MRPTPKLDTCPHCGSADIKLMEDQDMVYYGGASFCLCGGCGACGPSKGTRQEAADAWNRRFVINA